MRHLLRRFSTKRQALIERGVKPNVIRINEDTRLRLWLWRMMVMLLSFLEQRRKERGEMPVASMMMMALISAQQGAPTLLAASIKDEILDMPRHLGAEQLTPSLCGVQRRLAITASASDVRVIRVSLRRCADARGGGDGEEERLPDL